MNYTLYKEPISLDTLYIVQYLDANYKTPKSPLLPKVIIERNHPVDTFPAVLYGDRIYSGLDEVVKFYEQIYGISDLLTKAREWKKLNPDYRINNYTSFK